MPKTKQATESTYSRDLAHISNPDGWNTWPVCPLKRNQGRECGVIFDASSVEAGRWTVYIVNMFALKSTDLETVKQYKYETPDALLADGWQVD